VCETNETALALRGNLPNVFALERLRELLAAHDDGSGVWFDARAWIVTSKQQ
jgi:hypothetical protein